MFRILLSIAIKNHDKCHIDETLTDFQLFVKMHSRLGYHHVAKLLNEKGLMVYGTDHQGHGMSGRSNGGESTVMVMMIDSASVSVFFFF